MPLRYLFGPVSAEFAAQNLASERAAGRCLAFDAVGDTDVPILAGDSWDRILARLPEEWRPDFVVLYLPYTSIPCCLWSAPVPLIGLAADWNLLYHQTRHQARRLDLVLTDRCGVETLAKEGIAQALPANLFGCGREYLEHPWPERPRDVDVLFVGNLQAAVQRERLRWVARLASLASRWNVQIHTGVFGPGYRDLLARSRIVFNRSIRGECNRRVAETIAAGALLFQEADNEEVRACLREGEEYVTYRDDNLEELLHHYLENEAERCRIATAGRARLSEFGFENLWQEQLDRIEREWPSLTKHAGERALRETTDAIGWAWEALGSVEPGGPELEQALARALVVQPKSALLHQALGLVHARRTAVGRLNDAVAREAIGYFQRARAADPDDALAGLNVAEALVLAGDRDGAVAAARQTLSVLERGSPLFPEGAACARAHASVGMAASTTPQRSAWWRDGVRFPAVFDLFRVEWEAAAWRHAGQPDQEEAAKRRLVCWRLHSLLADLTGDLGHHYEAVLARPDLGATRGALGLALARAGRFADALAHLQAAVTENPFDREMSGLLFQSLGESGDGMGQRRLARQRRLLARAAPRIVSEEDWFQKTPPSGEELASIIVLCCNEVEVTRTCLESVLRHTRAPYELVIVDNGSTDGTAEYLEELRVCDGEAPTEPAGAGPAGRSLGVAARNERLGASWSFTMRKTAGLLPAATRRWRRREASISSF